MENLKLIQTLDEFDPETEKGVVYYCEQTNGVLVKKMVLKSTTIVTKSNGEKIEYPLTDFENVYVLTNISASNGVQYAVGTAWTNHVGSKKTQTFAVRVDNIDFIDTLLIPHQHNASGEEIKHDAGSTLKELYYYTQFDKNKHTNAIYADYYTNDSELYNAIRPTSQIEVVNGSTIQIGEGITMIGSGAFANLQNATINLPQSLTEFGHNVFYGARNITLNYAGTVAEWNNIIKSYDFITVESAIVTVGKSVHCSDGNVSLRN